MRAKVTASDAPGQVFDQPPRGALRSRSVSPSLSPSSSYLALGAFALAGAAGGRAAGYLVGRLPARYGVTIATPTRQATRRDRALLLLGAAAGAAVGHATSTSSAPTFAEAALQGAIALVLVLCLLAAAAVDLEHMILPNELTIGGAALALATSPIRPLGLRGAALGVAAALLLTLVPSTLYRLVRKRSGLGLGDVKLIVLAGAWLGPFGAVFVVAASAIQAATAAVLMRLFGLSYSVPPSVVAEIDALRALADAGDEEARRALAADPMAPSEAPDERGGGVLTTRLPLGPFLVLASLELFFARTAIANALERLSAALG